MVKNISNAKAVRDDLTGVKYYRNEDGNLVDAEGNELSIQNPETYTILDAGKPQIPQIDVSDGKLIGPDAPDEQGAIEAVALLALVHGRAILAVKPLSAEAESAGKVDVMAYEPASDRFIKLFREVPVPQVTVLDDGSLVLTINTVEDKEIVEEDGTKKTVMVFIRSSVNLIDDEGHVDSTYTPQEPVDKVVQVEDQIVLLSATATEYDEDNDINVVVPRDGLRIVRLSSVDIDDELSSIVLRGSSIDSVDSMTADFRGNLLVKAGQIMYYSNDDFRPRVVNDPAVAKTKGFDRLVRLTFEDDGNTARYLLADNDRNTVTLVDRRTPDRGHIVSVEKADA